MSWKVLQLAAVTVKVGTDEAIPEATTDTNS